MAERIIIKDFYDVETLQSLQKKLGCSQATIYRSLRAAKIPFYYIPPHRRQVLLHRASLWKLAGTAIWKKYLRALGGKLPTDRSCKKFIKNTEDSSFLDAYNQGLLSPLTLKEAISAVCNGLIPVYDGAFNIKRWFEAYLQGHNVFELPNK